MGTFIQEMLKSSSEFQPQISVRVLSEFDEDRVAL
jgi:hypothetical protein